MRKLCLGGVHSHYLKGKSFPAKQFDLLLLQVVMSSSSDRLIQLQHSSLSFAPPDVQRTVSNLTVFAIWNENFSWVWSVDKWDGKSRSRHCKSNLINGSLKFSDWFSDIEILMLKNLKKWNDPEAFLYYTSKKWHKKIMVLLSIVEYCVFGREKIAMVSLWGLM